MLATRVAYFSSQLAIYRGQAAKQEEIRRSLLRAVEEMDAEHQVLAHSSSEFTADPAVRHIYFDAPAELDRLTEEYIAAARSLAQGRADSAGPGDPGFDRVARMVTPVVELTDEAVNRYEVSAGRRIDRLRMMEIAGLLAMLAGLAMTWLVIFRPMARRIAQDMRAQEAANAELAQGNATLARQKAELEQEKQLTEDLRQRLQAILQNLKGMGVRLSIGNFGSALCSLRHLKQLPIDRLKIDRSFIQNLPDNAADAAMATSVINMSHNLCLQVVAEGVEMAEQASFLRDNGCDQFQGYYCSNPLLGKDIKELLQCGTAQ